MDGDRFFIGGDNGVIVWALHLNELINEHLMTSLKCESKVNF